MNSPDSRSILFLTPYSTFDPGVRMRILLHVKRLEAAGFKVAIRCFAGDGLFAKLHGKGLLHAFPGLIAASLARPFHILDLKRFDIVFVHRELLPFGPPVLERLTRRFCRTLVLDIDDAVYQPVPHVSRIRSLVKGTGRVKHLIRAADLVIAGSPYLAEQVAGMGARKVEYVPTGVDIDRYLITTRTAWETAPSGPFCIGWIGTRDTVHYLEKISADICELEGKYAIYLKIIGGAGLELPGVAVKWKSWSLEEEVEDVRSFHVGLYPLADTPWERAKCGYKALQYMAAGVPIVASPVGAVSDIITDEVNGLLVRKTNSWSETIGRVLADADLRETLVKNGYATVIERFADTVVGDRLVSVLSKL